MDVFDFSEEEIQEQLEILGYTNIPKHRLRQFKQDLDDLIHNGDWAAPRNTAQHSPPAFTKEKVSWCQLQESGHGFYLHAAKADSDRAVSTTGQRRSGLCDSYAKHSVTQKPRLPPSAPSCLRVESDPEDTLTPSLTDSYTSSPDTQGRRFIKRKVLRKHQGQSLVCDESFYSEDSDASSCLQERLAALDLSAQRDEDASLSAFQSYLRGTVGQTRRAGDLRPKPKSFIRPVTSQQSVKKSDPVAKYLQYKQLWELFKPPGETDRRALRWEIREQLAHRPPPPKPRRVQLPNTYVVPTEKKRSALRWEIRTGLAHGLLPRTHSY